MGRLETSLRIALVTAALIGSPAAVGAADAPKDFLASHLDTSVDPGVDFFQYANGGWLRTHPIPKSESAWGIGNEVDDELYARLRAISESAAKNGGAPGSDPQKIGDFWSTAMDVAKADALGVHPLDAELARIDAIRTRADVLDAVFALKPIGVGALFGVGVWQDSKDSATMAVQVQQGGLGLPERDFYFNPEAGVAKLRTAYVRRPTAWTSLVPAWPCSGSRA